MSKNPQISRERIALLMFLALIALGGVLACSYFFMGRQLSTTATVVDDATGNMQDYTLVVFSGVGDASSADDDLAGNRASGEDSYAVSLGQNAAIALKDQLASAYRRANVKTNLWKDHVFVSEVRDAYELKGAEAVTIDISNLGKYAAPTIIDAGSRKIGVFSVRSYISKAKLKSNVETLRAKGAQSMICICQNISMLSAFNGLDVVISLSRIYDDGKQDISGSALLIETPSRGNVGVILFSRSNATSFKTIKTL